VVQVVSLDLSGLHNKSTEWMCQMICHKLRAVNVFAFEFDFSGMITGFWQAL
jgi:hypothetical protein